MALSYRTRPTQYPISMAEVKRHLGLMSEDHDTDLDRMIAAATNMLQKSIGRQLVTAELRLTLHDFCGPDGFAYPIDLPMPPLVTIDAVKYRDTGGVEVTMTSNDYQLVKGENIPARLYPSTTLVWPVVQPHRVDAVIIDYTAGYGDQDDVPAEAKQWLLLVIRHWFDNPSAIGTQSKEFELSARSLRASLGIGYYART